MIKKVWRECGLSIVLITLFLIFWGGQALTGWYQYNEEQQEENQPTVQLGEYLRTPHFAESTFENWESEFMQMGMYVLFTVYLRQRGSAESRKFPEEEEKDQAAPNLSDAPWPVRRGGLWLKLYENSLFSAFVLLFLLSFVGHLLGSWGEFNEEQSAKGRAGAELLDYLFGSRFWFESFQNWQSEFLAVFSVVVLSIWLRQRHSPESKSVEAPHRETGNG